MNNEDIMREAWEHHDKLKEHPYWLNFDESLFMDLINGFHDLGSFIWKEEFREAVNWKKNPYWKAVSDTHDLNRFRRILINSKTIKPEPGETVPALQLYLQEYHSALTFDCDGYIKQLRDGGTPLTIFSLWVKKNSHYQLAPYESAACLSDDGDEIVSKILIKNDKELEESIKRYDGYADDIGGEFKEEWKKAKESLLSGAVEAMDHYCAYRKKELK